jgi:hypothetical protein
MLLYICKECSEIRLGVLLIRWGHDDKDPYILLVTIPVAGIADPRNKKPSTFYHDFSGWPFGLIRR